MRIHEYLQHLKKSTNATRTALGAALLPVIFALPVVAFVYLKMRHASPPMDQQATPGWAGLSTNYVSLEWFAIFSSAAFLGAVGSTVSFFARRRGNRENLSRPQTVAGTQLLGALFANVLMLTFVGGLVAGSIFPSFSATSWSDLGFRLPDWSKLLVWSFIAGFSERFVPDLLDNLILRSQKEDVAHGRPDGSGDS
jgi:amino acid permease